MDAPHVDSPADVILRRFRRQVGVRRALVILEAISALLFLLFLSLEIALPGIVGNLFHHAVRGLELLAGLLGALLLFQVGVAALEWLMGATLHVPTPPLRRIAGILYLIPGVMLLRRVVQLVLLAWWISLLCVALLAFIGVSILLAPALLWSDPVASLLGHAVDAIDQAMSWAYHGAEQGLRELIRCPTLQIEKAEDRILPLLHDQATVSLPDPAPAPLQNA